MQALVKDGYGLVLIREGISLEEDLTTRPILGVDWTVDTAAVIITTNLPFSEWSSVFPNTRLCKALLDRITDRAHILETGTESYRFRRTMERKKKT